MRIRLWFGTRVPRLLADLATAKADGSCPQFMNNLARTEVLMLDDWAEIQHSRQPLISRHTRQTAQPASQAALQENQGL